MRICNVKEIFDNGEFISVITTTGSAIHLPRDKHSIVIELHDIGYGCNVIISFGEAN